MINEYYNEIRKEIAMDFGLEAGGYAPRNPKNMTFKQAMYLNNKYGFEKGTVIAKRYASLQKVGK